MTGIVLSAAVRQNLLSLQNTASLLATTQNDLSTGNKVNSALDNPTNFFTAQGLNNRASDISNLLDGISNGVQVLQAANTGLTSLESLVNQAQSIANQALQTSIGYSTKSQFTSAPIAGATAQDILGTPTYTTGSFTGAVVDNHLTTAVAITGATLLSGAANTDSLGSTLTGGSDTLTVNGKTISFAAGTGTNASTSSGATIYLGNAGSTVNTVLSAINTITGQTTATLTGGQISFASGTTGAGVTIGGTSGALAAFGLNTGGTSTGLASTVTGLTSAGTDLIGTSTTPLNTGQTLTIGATGGGTASTITFGTGYGQISSLDELNTALASNNLEATINSTTGAITISTTNDAASATIGVVGGTATSASSDTFYGNTGPQNAPVADQSSQNTRATLVAQYNAILTQITNTAQDSSYNGVNLLNGDQLQLTFNETGTSKVNITGVQDTAAGLGLSSLTGGSDFIDNNSTNKVLSLLTAVSTTLRSQASAFGSNLSVVQTRQDFNKSLINVLQTGSANLVQADINEEAANSQALSTRQSLSVSALSLANQAQQSVLQLLR